MGLVKTGFEIKLAYLSSNLLLLFRVKAAMTAYLLKPVIFLVAVLLIAQCVVADSDEHEEGELATVMGELQRLTHKLSLSTQAENPKLAKFYLYESLEILKDIQADIPEYEDMPIAIHLDRFAFPAYQPLMALLKNSDKAKTSDWDKATDEIINSCNDCHSATKFEFIKIQRPQHNPFAQDFKP